MKYSELLGQSTKDIQKQYDSRSHELLTKAGFIDQVASGIYTMLPLGRKVLRKIETIIREEMDAIGGQEILMPSLEPKTLWDKTGRWDSVDVLFQVEGKHGNEYALGPTHEEIVTPLAQKFIRSYRDLPMALYHISTKFRDEPRPKSGILRGREFGMKDLYSFHATKEDFKQYYKIVSDSYLKLFARLGLTDVKITEASGGDFTKKFSHEFNVITSAGEVELLHCDTCTFSQNTEIATQKKGDTCTQCHKGKLLINKAVEIGNIFDIGTRFTEAFNFKVTNKDGSTFSPLMGCYGIGTTRLLGAIVEVHNRKEGIMWPKEVTPFHVYLINLKKDLAYANVVYRTLLSKNISVLFDERENVSAGAKFMTSDLVGIPLQLVVSEKHGNDIEYKERAEEKPEIVPLLKLIEIIQEYYLV